MMPNNETQRKVVDLLWSDPINVCGLTKDKDLDLKNGRWTGDGYNDHRNNGTYFGPDIVRNFCKRNDIDLIIRAHECVNDGMKVFAEGRLVTIFSAPKYCGHENAGAIAEITRHLQIQFKALSATDSDSRWSHHTKDLDAPRREDKHRTSQSRLISSSSMSRTSSVNTMLTTPVSEDGGSPLKMKF
jgi:hypothetical protein